MKRLESLVSSIVILLPALLALALMLVQPLMLLCALLKGLVALVVLVSATPVCAIGLVALACAFPRQHRAPEPRRPAVKVQPPQPRHTPPTLAQLALRDRMRAQGWSELATQQAMERLAR